MKNLTLNATHAANTSSIKAGNLVSGNNVDDITNSLDSMFMTELDSASLALLSQYTSNAKDGNPSKDILTSTEDKKDIDPINLMDAMQLAASQNLLQSQGPQLQSIPNTDLMKSEASIDNTMKLGDSDPSNTLSGIANQNLLNILNGSVPQNIPQTSTLNKDLLGSGYLQKSNNSQLNLQEINNKHDHSVADATQILQQDIPVPLNGAIDLQNQQLQNKSSAVQLDLLKAKSTTLDKQQVIEGAGVKVASLSDALKNIGDVKVLSVDQTINKIKLPQSFAMDDQKSQKIDLPDFSKMSSPIPAVPEQNQEQSQVIKEPVTEKKPVEEFSGVSNGFMMNPGFTNHINHEVSLKLDAVNTSLTAGPLHTELLSAAKSGGGRISLEVNPDNAGPIRIDLQIDQGGQARLMVQGASESTQARLEQGSDQLRQQFAQMGLQLSLDMRQNSTNNAFNQQSNESTNQFSNNQSQQMIASGANSNRIGREDLLGANLRVNADRSNGINLFA
jgi:hypothetical protein